MKFDIQRRKDNTIIILKGALTEESEYEFLAVGKTIGTTRIRLDCGGISRINSFGAMRWIQFVTGLAQKATLTFERCPACFIDYGNVIRPFAAQGLIASFFAPFHCSSCRQTRDILIETSALPSLGQFPRCPCPHCGSDLEPEVKASEYLYFLTAAAV